MTKQVSNENEINSLCIRVNEKNKCILDCSSFMMKYSENRKLCLQSLLNLTKYNN